MRSASDIFWRAKHAVAKRAGRGAPPFTDFSAPLDPKLADRYPGQVSKLFFGHDGPIVNKWLHYLPVYDRVLGPYAGSKVRMLEIGVSKGGSLDIWRKFLGPDATIFGIDINPECAKFDGRSGAVRIGSQADHEFLERTVREMCGLDVVLDDGSHIASHQRASFETLFPLLSYGGAYIIEDLQTAYWPWFEGGLKRKGTAIEFLKDKIDAMHRHYRVAGTNRTESIPEIESVQFFDSIAVLYKKKQLPRVNVMAGESSSAPAAVRPGLSPPPGAGGFFMTT
jgi:hypothetical protein